ncbi:MAG: histidine phosphatase family protein [Bryobacterales bacterium]|nr:histidine phosphatase family protein [Bryobacterales bacterium]
MEIYLMRHGIAEDPGVGMRDSDRALTGEGKKKLRDVLQVAKRAGVKPAAVLSSPYKRAKETAALACEVLALEGEVVLSDHFTPMADPRKGWEEIRLFTGEPSVLVTTHEPFTGLMVAYLLGMTQLPIDVKKGALIRVDVDGLGPHPRGVLKWMLTPRLAF